MNAEGIERDWPGRKDIHWEDLNYRMSWHLMQQGPNESGVVFKFTLYAPLNPPDKCFDEFLNGYIRKDGCGTIYSSDGRCDGSMTLCGFDDLHRLHTVLCRIWSRARKALAEAT